MIEETKTQRDYGWYKARLGKFTASNAGKLMGKTDISKKTFGDTAKGYIYAIGLERKAKEDWDDKSIDQLDDYIKVTAISSREIQWGVDYEATARAAFEMETGMSVRESGTCIKEDRPYVSASPDGFVGDDALVEFKCPQFAKYGKYTMEIKDGESMKAVVPDYYWQVMQQLQVTDRQRCYFAWFHPWLGIKYVVIERNEEDINLLLKRIDEAEEIAKATYNEIKK